MFMTSKNRDRYNYKQTAGPQSKQKKILYQLYAARVLCAVGTEQILIIYDDWTVGAIFDFVLQFFPLGTKIQFLSSSYFLQTQVQCYSLQLWDIIYNSCLTNARKKSASYCPCAGVAVWGGEVAMCAQCKCIFVTNPAQASQIISLYCISLTTEVVRQAQRNSIP